MRAENSSLDSGPRFRDFFYEDVDELVALGGRFFEESEFPDFARFSPENMRMVLANIDNNPGLDGFIFEDGGKIRGFIFYQLDLSYTEDPVALMWLFYVTPKYRKSPVGRELLKLAESHAKSRGATVFYAGSMSGIPHVEKSLKNLYQKAGYKQLFWGRKKL